MTLDIHLDPARRHDFVLLAEVTDGNPNGDPDADNMPRVDPETMQGLITDAALKRKVRDFVALDHPGEERFKVYVEEGVALNKQHTRAYTALSLEPKPKADANETALRQWMCENFFDIRMFGAVMTTKVNCGQVRGPVQLTFGRSVDPVVPLSMAITRVTKTDEDGSKEMGRKQLIPYGLYVAHGFFSARLAAQTGVDEQDMAAFWRALTMMFEHDRSAARGMMSTRGLYVFTHDSDLGDAPAHVLFDGVRVERVGDGAARSFHDYQVTVEEPPARVTLTRIVG